MNMSVALRPRTPFTDRLESHLRGTSRAYPLVRQKQLTSVKHVSTLYLVCLVSIRTITVREWILVGDACCSKPEACPFMEQAGHT